jgi:hypothetical protein
VPGFIHDVPSSQIIATPWIAAHTSAGDRRSRVSQRSKLIGNGWVLQQLGTDSPDQKVSPVGLEGRVLGTCQPLVGGMFWFILNRLPGS